MKKMLTFVYPEDYDRLVSGELDQDIRFSADISIYEGETILIVFGWFDGEGRAQSRILYEAKVQHIVPITFWTRETISTGIDALTSGWTHGGIARKQGYDNIEKVYDMLVLRYAHVNTKPMDIIRWDSSKARKVT